MAELLGTVASGISVAALAIQIGKSLIKLKCFWNTIKEVPEDIALLIEEIEDFNQLLLEIEESYDQAKLFNIALDSISSERCLLLCRKSSLKLKTLVDTLVLDVEKQRGLQKKLKFARIALQKDKVEKYRRQLERDMGRLSLSFSVGSRNLQLKQLGFVREASLQHSDAMTAHSENVIQTMCNSSNGTRRLGCQTSIQPGFRLAENFHIHQQNPNTREWLLCCLGRASYRLDTRESTPSGHLAHKRAAFVARYYTPIWLFRIIIEARVSSQLSGFTIQFRIYNVLPWESPIFVFAKEDNLEGLRDLLRNKKASPYDIDCKRGLTALHFAAQRGNFGICKLLLSEGADSNVLSNCCMTPMRSVVRYWKRDIDAPILDTMRLLANSGADFHPEDNMVFKGFRGNQKQFCWLRDQYLPNYISQPLEERVHTAMHIMENVCPINVIWLALGCNTLQADMFQIKDRLGYTLLHYFGIRFTLANILMATFVDLNCMNHQHIPPLFIHPTIQGNRNEQAEWRALVRQSLELPINLHEGIDGIGITPLFLALYGGSEPETTNKILKTWLQLLVSSGVDLIKFGQEESRLRNDWISKLGELEKDTRSAAASLKAQPSILESIVGFHYGPSPDDWYIWWMEKSDVFAGEFWDRVEQDMTFDGEELLIPGAWIDQV